MRMSGEQLQKETSLFVNGFNGKEQKNFIEEMSREHRTLQQSYTRFVFQWIKAMAEQKHTDARNQAAKETCQEIINLIDLDKLPLI